MSLLVCSYNIAANDGGDWSKATLDLPATCVEELREVLAGLGISVEHFKTLPAYQLPLASGKYDWMRDL